MKYFTTLFLLLIPCVFLNAQVTFSHFPKDKALYPRDLSTNLAAVPIQGNIGSVVADSLIIMLERSDGALSRNPYSLNDFAGGDFDLSFDIEAGLQFYNFTASLQSVDSTWLVAAAGDVVCGDVIVVEGQSNAQSGAYYGDANIWQNNYVRCFGNPNPQDFTDEQWYIAEGNGFFTPGAVGQWPLRLGSLIQENLQVPIAIINGADPGKPIEFFQRNDALPKDPNTNYGRLLQRLTNAGLQDHIRAILYYQGENDADRATIHKTLFEALYADWTSDYTNVEAFYVMQVREGCGAPSLQLRQYQKDFENYLPNLKTMTVNGIVGHDGCHYSVQGYQQLGEKLYKGIARDVYHQPATEQLNVRVLSAAYSDESNTQITLKTDAHDLVAQTGSNTDFKLLGVSTNIINITATDSTIILDLDQPVYDALAGISYSGHAGNAGGWVLNSDGYGLFSFYNMPIENHTALANFDIPGIMSGSGNCLSFDGVDDRIYLGSVLGNSYTKEGWINWKGGELSNNIISGAANTAFWIPNSGNGNYLSAGHNNSWFQVMDPEPMQPNQWTHVAVTYDQDLGEMRLYKNGNLVSQAQNIPPHNDPELFVGSYAGGYTFQGKIDEVRVWDYARTITDIRANMCQKLSGHETGLSCYYRLDQTDGIFALNASSDQDGQLLGFENNGWQRSAAPIGTKSTYAYTDTSRLSLALASGDSLVLSPVNNPKFVHLYFTEEVPNVLQPASGNVLVDNSRYFGVYYPKESIDSFTLEYHYKGNPFSMVDEPRLNLLQRKSNAQPFWENVDTVQLDAGAHVIKTTSHRYQEYILSLKLNTVSAKNPNLDEGLMYPNPCHGVLFFRELSIAKVQLYDARGKLVLEHSGTTKSLQLSILPAGLYFVVVQDTNAAVFTGKLILGG